MHLESYKCVCSRTSTDHWLSLYEQESKAPVVIYPQDYYMALHTQNMLVHITRVSPGRVETRFGCGGIFDDSFIANFHRVCHWKNYENPLRIDKVSDQA